MPKILEGKISAEGFRINGERMLNVVDIQRGY